MTLPVLDILSRAKDRGEFALEFNGARDRDDWEREIEIYAPGYLQLEAEGNGSKYNPACLIDPEEVSMIRQRIAGWLPS